MEPHSEKPGKVQKVGTTFGEFPTGNVLFTTVSLVTVCYVLINTVDGYASECISHYIAGELQSLPHCDINPQSIPEISKYFSSLFGRGCVK